MRVLFHALVFILTINAVALPDGFSLTVYTDQVPSARQMAQTESGLLLVGSRSTGNLYAVVPPENDTDRPEVIVFESGLQMPTGLALLGDDLYVGAVNRILKYSDIEKTFRSNPTPTVITSDLPRNRSHGWKYLSFGPDGYLYFNVGAPCNICLSRDERFASILRMDPVTGETEVYAHGVRNTVGITWHPQTQKMWFSENGRDWLGDDSPPEEINVVEKVGSHFGYPFIHGDDILDPEFGSRIDESMEFVKPTIKIQAHSAALGLKFYTHDLFPEEYSNALFIAEHGSWNRSAKVGYRVSVVRFVDENPVYEPFVDVWLRNERVTGRPSDVLVANDGRLLISDDQADSIYAVTYKKSSDN